MCSLDVARWPAPRQAVELGESGDREPGSALSRPRYQRSPLHITDGQKPQSDSISTMSVRMACSCPVPSRRVHAAACKCKQVLAGGYPPAAEYLRGTCGVHKPLCRCVRSAEIGFIAGGALLPVRWLARWLRRLIAHGEQTLAVYGARCEARGWLGQRRGAAGQLGQSWLAWHASDAAARLSDAPSSPVCSLAGMHACVGGSVRGARCAACGAAPSRVESSRGVARSLA